MRNILLVVALSVAASFIQASPPNHEPFTKLLGNHVTSDGMVNYKALKQEKSALDAYCKSLSENAPESSWTQEEKLSYWINVYNAFTLKLIVDNYPVKSIRDLHPTVKIPGVNTVWHKEFFEIGGEPMSLDEVEHGILRKEFNEPRIHFAINCASISCPVLRNEAFTADKLERQLNEQARLFVNDGERNKIRTEKAALSPIFKWFKGDFTQQGTLQEFINKYSEIKIGENTPLTWLDYDWTLNEASGK